MKILKTRKEIAQAINFGKYPVVYCHEISKARNDYGWKLAGVRIETGRGYAIAADLMVYKDELNLTTSSYGCCIAAAFGWNDVQEMAEKANRPLLRANSEFVLVIGSEARKSGIVAIVNTQGIDPNCQTPLVIGESFAKTLVCLGENIID